MFEQLLNSAKDRLGKYANYFLLAVSILLIVSLARNILKINRANEKIEVEEKMVQDLMGENEELKSTLEKLKSEEYKERQLRDRLGLAKEGEIIVVLPDEEILRKLAPKSQVEEEVLPDPNWKRWLNLFPKKWRQFKTNQSI